LLEAHRNLFTWSISTLKGGASAKLTITVKGVRAATASVLAVVVSPNPDPHPLNNVTAAAISIKRA
jgi:hypothetical protein